MNTIHLKDVLHHEKYNWPNTLITQSVSFDPAMRDHLCLQNDAGESVPFQLTDEAQGHAKLHFIADLKSGEDKTYRLIENASVSEQTQSDDYVRTVALELHGQSLTIDTHGRRMELMLPFSDISCARTNDGAIFTDYLISASEGQKRYTLRIRVLHALGMLEFEEEMAGFSQEEAHAVTLRFTGFDFTERFSWCRPVEKIDAYCKDDGTLPVTVMPYENWVPWYQSKFIAFAEHEITVGLFIRDCLKWKEEGYPIWGSNRRFGIRFQYCDDVLSARFPLKNGSRSTVLTFFDGNTPQSVTSAWMWQAFLNLDKVRKWKLEWEDTQSAYPRFFDPKLTHPCNFTGWYCVKGESLTGDKLTSIIDERSESVNRMADFTTNGMGPVGNREFAQWTVIFDTTAREMSREQFDRNKAFFALMAYATQDENYMPTQNLLAGHPNFLADSSCVSGFFAALFPNHPENKRFVDYFCKTVDLNLQHHIRPDVATYDSLGGRETESTGCYSQGCMNAYVRVCKLFSLAGYPVPLCCDNGAKWLNWSIQSLSAPVDGRRIIPQQGAHCRESEIPYVFMEFAELLEKDYPELAQNAYAMCENSPLIAFEIATQEEDPFYSLFEHKYGGKLSLKSEKFTGYGCILREAVGTPDEISIHVQQLDRGPNYRWGTFENTGNGGIFYYAAGKRYSFVGQEDTGDRNIGAEEGNCGFAVLDGHLWRNIGFHELTEPLYDFPMLKQTKLLADDAVKQFYSYRRVSLVEKDYIVLYDALTHMRAYGCFLWTVNQLEEFPQIWQLLPAAEPTRPTSLDGVFVTGNGDANRIDATKLSRSVYYEGNGNFLTVVSHRKDITVSRTEFGAKVELPNRIDFIFEDRARIRYRAEGICFDGYSGMISLHQNGYISGAITEGRKIQAHGFSIAVSGKCGVSFELDADGEHSKGVISAQEKCKLTIDSETHTLERGNYLWSYDGELKLTRLADRHYDDNAHFVRDTRRHEFGFNGYDFEDEGEILVYPK